MNIPVIKIEDVTFYTDDIFKQSFLDTVCRKWVCPIAKRDFGKGLIPVWPGKITWWNRLKSHLGFVKQAGFYGVFIPEKRLILIVALYAGKFRLLKREFVFNPFVATVVAHEYQHAGIFSSIAAGRIAQPFITEWYARFLRRYISNVDTRRYAELLASKILPLEQKIDFPISEIRNLWKALYKKYKTLKPIVDLLHGRLHRRDYIHYIWIPAYDTYKEMFKQPSPYMKMLRYVGFYQEVMFPSEIQAIKASIYPKERSVLKVALLAKLRTEAR